MCFASGLILQFGEHYLLWTFSVRVRADAEMQMSATVRPITVLGDFDRMQVTIAAFKGKLLWTGMVVEDATGMHQTHDARVSQGEALVILFPTHRSLVPVEAIQNSVVSVQLETTVEAAATEKVGSSRVIVVGPRTP